MPTYFPGLSKRTTSEGLRTAFAQFGEVADGITLLFHVPLVETEN